MRNWSKALLVVAAVLVFVAPQARASSGSPNWLNKHVFHHQAKTKVHPQHDNDKALKRQAKAKQRTEKMRQRAGEAHPTAVKSKPAPKES